MSKVDGKTKVAELQAAQKELEKRYRAIVAKICAIAERETRNVAELAELAYTLREEELFRVKFSSWRKFCMSGALPYSYAQVNSLANYWANEQIRPVLIARGNGAAKAVYSLAVMDNVHHSTVRAAVSDALAKDGKSWEYPYDALVKRVSERKTSVTSKEQEKAKKVARANVKPEQIKEARERSAIVSSAIAEIDAQIDSLQKTRKELASELEALSLIL